MISIDKVGKSLVLEYDAESGDSGWVDEKIKTDGTVVLVRTFRFDESHRFEAPADGLQDLIYPYERGVRFLLGKLDDGYYRIDADILGTKSNVLIHESVPIGSGTFTAYRQIAIFPKLSVLIEGEVIIGGDADGAIPTDEFLILLKHFPNSTEMTHYTRSKIARILCEYVDIKSDPELMFERYLRRREGLGGIKSKPDLVEFELNKFIFIRDQIIYLLNHAAEYSESQWQALMLEFILVLFPKYVSVIRELSVRDFYTKPEAATLRRIDIAVLDASGNLDIIEIKKPFEYCLVSKSSYRDNFVPRRELSGTIMQVEKYLFHLNKWGVQGEKIITDDQIKKGVISSDVSVQITHPKAMIIAGRSNNLSKQQLFDFEIMKRQYANLMDIMSYDDLLGRLDRIIDKFRSVPVQTQTT